MCVYRALFSASQEKMQSKCALSLATCGLLIMAVCAQQTGKISYFTVIQAISGTEIHRRKVFLHTRIGCSENAY